MGTRTLPSRLSAEGVSFLKRTMKDKDSSPPNDVDARPRDRSAENNNRIPSKCLSPFSNTTTAAPSDSEADSDSTLLVKTSSTFAKSTSVTHVILFQPGLTNRGHVSRSVVSVTRGRAIPQLTGLQDAESCPLPSRSGRAVRRAGHLAGFLYAFRRSAAYTLELDVILNDSRMALTDNNDDLVEDVLCVQKAKQRSALQEFQDLEDDWKAFLRNRMREWGIYGAIVGALAGFLYIDFQTSNSRVPVASPDTTSGWPFVALLACMFHGVYILTMIGLLRNSTLHYAVHFKAMRIRNRAWWELSIETKFALAQWGFFAAAVCTGLAFLQDYYQTTAAKLSWDSRLFNTVTQVPLYSIALVGVVLFGSTLAELSSCSLATARCAAVPRTSKSDPINPVAAESTTLLQVAAPADPALASMDSGGDIDGMVAADPEQLVRSEEQAAVGAERPVGQDEEAAEEPASAESETASADVADMGDDFQDVQGIPLEPLQRAPSS
uniref:Uncharacterized protein n=1 Tax=Mycena chlorophos TaxID=658473 RepID=A0ABQ0M5V8_MYCCL|nr:predicted protein [Mycena chlorophos]